MNFVLEGFRAVLEGFDNLLKEYAGQ